MSGLSGISFSQTDSLSSLHIIARPLPDSILLRWAPSDYKTWQLGNQYGYIVERYTIIRDSSLVKDTEKRILTSSPLKPLGLYEWEPLVKTNKYAAIAAQAIYGETFKMDVEGFNPQNVWYKSLEQKQRFSFALFSADMSPGVAKAMGLWVTDKNAKKNEKYLYRVFINLPDSLADKRDTAFVFTGVSEYQPLSAPVEFSSVFGDRTATLSWNTFAQDNIYNAWQIERSAIGGRSFSPITNEPIVPILNQVNQTPEYTFRVDSLPENNKEYQYRLRGITPFGEFGTWSAIVKGQGNEEIGANPNIRGYDYLKQQIIIKWEFPRENEKQISGFKILRSDNASTGFTELSSKVKPGERVFNDKNPLETAYYKVCAWRDSSKVKYSYPYLVQLSDSIPPKKPLGIAGVADTSGIVRLNWKPNKDHDIYGYRIYRSASGNDEYSQRTHRPVSDTFFIDTLSKKDLNSTVYYKIAAFDQRQNQSEFSKILIITKPDIIPPSAPVMKATKPLETGIELVWINSSSSDVYNHELYRKTTKDTSWTKVTSVPYKKGEQESAYTDNNCPPLTHVQYKVVANDKSGNQSEPCLSVIVESLKPSNIEGVKKITSQVDYQKGIVLLTWKSPDKEVKYFKIYRQTTEKPYTVYETLAGNTLSFQDYGLKAGITYAYRIKVVFVDGSVSGFSEELTLNY